MQVLIDDSEQGSLEWLVARIGYVTASNVAKVMAGGKGVSRYNYLVKTLCEILNNKPTPSFRNGYMADGNDREDFARGLYEKVTGTKVTQTGFWYIPEEKLGASTDGLVENSKGMIEIKNVTATEQIELLTKKKMDGSRKIKSNYMKQMQTQMYVYNKEWCDFVSQSLGSEEHGELPNEYKLEIVRVNRDEAMIEEIRRAVAKFHTDLRTLKKTLEGART